MNKIILILCLTYSANVAVWAQNKTISNEPTAYLTYNGEKTTMDNGIIEFNTSFFIKHISMDENVKQKHITEIVKNYPSFTKLEIMNITENKVATDKGFMVIVVLKATDNTDLTNKIKYLLNELNVKSVNYGDVFYKIQDFKF